MAKIHRLLPLLLLSAGCNKLFAKDTPAPTAEGSDAPKAAASAKSEHADHGDHTKEEGGRFGVPFAWESSPEEPLAKARSFMAEVLKANETFMGQGHEHFKPFVNAETPRATVLTCADSRVQSAAWDQNPENDDYTVRNLGNQLSTSLGSVQYGVDHLNTPVLLIIGHTGCDAVKAALEKDTKSKGPIADEIARIELPPQRKSKDFDTTWKNAVIANVNKQVEQAVSQFGNHVQAGDLTIVGAVYDFRDDMDDGHGRLHIVNVNSNVEEARLAAFEEAVQEVNKKAAAAASPFGKRTYQAPAALPLEHNQPLSPGARASVNALNMLASGSFPGLRPGMAIPGTVDLKAAPSFRPITRPAPGHGAADEHAGHEDDAQESGGADDHGKAATGHGAAPARKKASTAHAAPAAGHEAPDEHGSEPASGHAEAAEPDAHDEDPHAPAEKTQPAARAAVAPTVQTGARVAGQTPLPSSANGHAVAPAAARPTAPTSMAPRAPVAPVASARAVAPRSGPPVSRPLTPMAGGAASPVAGARSGPPRSGPPVSRPLTPAPATRYPAPAPAMGAPAASRQATPAPALAPGRAPATAPAAGGAPAARGAPSASQPRAPAAAPRTAAPAAPGPPRATTPPQAGQRGAPAPGAAAPAPGAAAPNKAPAKAAAPRGTTPAAGKSPAAAPTPAPAQPSPPAAPAAPKQPARPRLPMPGPVTAGPAGPEAEDAPPNRQKPPAGRAKAGAPTAPAPTAPVPTAPAKGAAPAPGKPPAAPPKKTH